MSKKKGGDFVMFKAFIRRVQGMALAFVFAVLATFGLVRPVRADMTALFTAADVSSLSTNVSTMLIAFIGVGLIFTAYRYIRKSGVR